MKSIRGFELSATFERWRRTLHDAWFAPGDPRVPAICRLILFSFVHEGFGHVGAGPWTKFSDTAFRPIGILAALHVPIFSDSTLHALGWVYPVVSTGAVIGLFYPITGIATAVLTLYFAWFAQSSGKINHGGLLYLCALFPIALARAADAWSIDALIRRWRGKPPPEPSGAYRWPARFLGLMVATMYGTAGITKLVRTGFSWAFSDTLRILFLSHHFTHDPLTRIGPWLAKWPLLCRVLGFSALLLELSAPLSQLSRWAYRVVIPSLALLQLSIWLIMGVLFREMIVVFSCLLPWDIALSRLDAVVGLARERYAPRASATSDPGARRSVE